MVGRSRATTQGDHDDRGDNGDNGDNEVQTANWREEGAQTHRCCQGCTYWPSGTRDALDARSRPNCPRGQAIEKRSRSNFCDQGSLEKRSRVVDNTADTGKPVFF